MSFLQALFLGILQGITEFFPVSSSAHLTLLKSLLGLEIENPALFNLACHLGTALSTAVYLRKEIFSLFFKKKQVLFYILALLPLMLLYPLIGHAVKTYSKDPIYLGPAFLLTSFFLAFCALSKKRAVSYAAVSETAESGNSFRENRGKKNMADALFIGLLQTAALIPGISRSASTIFAGILRKWQLSDILTFSFLLAVPTVLGGAFLESWQSFKEGGFQVFANLQASVFSTAFFSSFICGLAAIRLIFSLKKPQRLLYFSIYTFLAGIFSLIYFR